MAFIKGFGWFAKYYICVVVFILQVINMKNELNIIVIVLLLIFGALVVIEDSSFDAFGEVIDGGNETANDTPKSNYIVTGLYLYDNSVFGVVPNLKPSGRGELEITDVNNYYIDKGKMKSTILDQGVFWSDAGSFETIHTCQRWMWLNDVM